MTDAPDDQVSLWTARPWLARAIRGFVMVAPLAISVLVAWCLSSVGPRAHSFAGGAVRWMVIAGISTLVLVGVDKLARRLLPLATLFGLTLAFPDQAPSRYQLALRHGSTAQLRVRIAEARAGKLGDTPEEAAQQVLELVMALSLHDRLTRGHSERVRAYSEMIGAELGLTHVELDRLRWAGLLHDIGKLMISADILNKPGKLTSYEFDVIKQHPEFGRQLVEPLREWLGEAARAVWEHHERWDGKGYPVGLATTDISLAGRIVNVADSYDVMTSARSYKKPISPVEARAELTRCSGSQFDPAVVRAFMNVSLGRLRLAMGPLSWLAQIPMFPTAVAGAATQGAATAATVFAGTAAASMGLGMSGEPVIASEPAVVASAEAATIEPDLDAGLGGAGPTSTIVIVGTTQPVDAASAAAASGDPGASPVPAPAPADGGRRTEDPAPTGTAPADGSVTTTVAPSTTRPVSTTQPARPSTTVATTLATTVATTLPVTTVTVAPEIVAASTTTLPVTVPVTTPAPTTTLPPVAVGRRPDWLPAANVPTSFYPHLPNRADLSDHDPYELDPTAPTRNNVMFDPDRDGWAGLTVPRAEEDGNGFRRAATFDWEARSAVTVGGPASATVFIGSTSVVPVDLVVRGRLLVCDDDQLDSNCTLIGEHTVGAQVGIFAQALTFDFGVVGAEVPERGVIRFAIDVPTASSADAVLYADTRVTPSALTLVFP